MKVEIDRATWSAGKHNRSVGRDCSNALLTEDSQQRCCLGFLGMTCGLSDEHATAHSCPSDVSSRCPWPSGLFDLAPHRGEPRYIVLEWEHVFAALNDFADIDDATRESWISAGFRTVLDVDVAFIGEYPELPLEISP